MGLISKIEDKLSGRKSSDQQTYDSSSSGAPSNIQHPISSSQQRTSPTVASSSSADRDGYGSQPSKYNTTSAGDYGSQPSKYDTTTNGGYGQQPGSYQTETRTTPTGYGSNNMPTVSTDTTTTTSTDKRQYYGPYSRKGQQIAANAATNDYGMSPSTSSSSHPNADANVARSNRGGVVNNSDDRGYEIQRYPGTRGPGHVPSTGNQDVSTMSGEPALRHHYGRDVSGGAAGAYENGRSSENRRSTDRSRNANFSHVQPTGGHINATSATGYRNYDDRQEHMTQAQKMNHAYAQGYRDAMEVMKKEMILQQQQMMQKFEQF